MLAWQRPAVSTNLKHPSHANSKSALPIALYIYERYLILDQEVMLMWRRQLSLASAIYLLMHVSMFTVLWSSVATAAVTGCEVRLRCQIQKCPN